MLQYYYSYFTLFSLRFFPHLYYALPAFLGYTLQLLLIGIGERCLWTLAHPTEQLLTVLGSIPSRAVPLIQIPSSILVHANRFDLLFTVTSVVGGMTLALLGLRLVLRVHLCLCCHCDDCFVHLYFDMPNLHCQFFRLTVRILNVRVITIIGSECNVEHSVRHITKSNAG